MCWARDGLLNRQVVRAIFMPTPAPTILVLEDESHISAVLRALLPPLGFQPMICSDGASGVCKYIEAPETYGLVMADYSLPGMTGIEAIRRMRAVATRPFILMSGSHPEEMAGCLTEGERSTVVILSKPFGKASLQAAIQRAIHLAAA